MRHATSGRLVAAATAAFIGFWATPIPVWASNASAISASAYAAGPAKDPPPDDDEDLVIIDDDEMEGGGEEPEGDQIGDQPADDTDVGDFLGDDSGDATAADGTVGKADKDSEAKQIKAEIGLISVVQRQRMLKKGRFELQPQFGISINDPYVRHYTLGVDFNYWITNRMAIGLTGTGFIGAKTPRYDNIRFQEGLLLTANQILWQASVNYTYNPFYGKIAIFNRWLLHWEGSVWIGGGAMQTRVIPRYESLHDPFSTVTGGGQFGLGGKFYTSSIDWLSVNFGVRTWIFADKLEPFQRGPNDDMNVATADLPELDDPDAAKDASDFEVAFNVVFFLGVSFYLPSSFDYTTPR